MQWVVYDTADPRRRLLTEPGPWRALLQFLCDRGVIGPSRAGRLVWYLGGEGTSITAQEAHAIADHIQSAVLPGLAAAEALRLPVGHIWFDAATTPTLPPGLLAAQVEDPVLAHHWIESFLQLCTGCGGLGVIVEGVPE